MDRPIRQVWVGLLDLLFPPRCAGCDAPGAHLCDGCRLWFRRIEPPVCRSCGDPEPIDRAGLPVPACSDRVCAPCRAKPPEFDLARSIFTYEDPLREAIHALKFKGRRTAAGPLGALLADLAPPEVIQGVRAVVPVPLHPSRFGTRGFNQAELLARPLAARLAVPCLPCAIRRLRQESPQVELSAAARRRSVSGVFAPGYPAVSGTVLLVDDVFSTGSTAGACARALRAHGASRVVVLTLARTRLRRGSAPEGA